ncbi:MULTISPECIES: pyridoxamine 5'-phosphate oxidase family protein [Thermocrispum]|jgi:general stress protein 26|uniref:Pyridoxamine 5'-phosphate oxidase family protein n=1 Tax=Thermocrispum agreste TaxID=37925 RepID=A0A2W4IUI6_9PSEU|nr:MULTISPECIES: pyridoxamine 5'-phosphate oxidase family protein [Thermocrispum]PZM90344.1 MAG: hypothetical protein DIU77_18065 [Thermocrispum agreste]
MASEDADDLPGAKDIEDLSRARLAPEGRAELFAEQTECVLSFLEDGLPTAVVLSYLVDEHGHFWFATVEGRRQVRGVDADPRVAVVVSSAGTGLPGRRMVALRGRARVHRDRAVVMDRVRRLAPRLAPGDPEAFVRLLDSPNRVVIEVVPTEVTASHDSTRLAGDGRGGPARS